MPEIGGPSDCSGSWSKRRTGHRAQKRAHRPRGRRAPVRHQPRRFTTGRQLRDTRMTQMLVGDQVWLESPGRLGQLGKALFGGSRGCRRIKCPRRARRGADRGSRAGARSCRNALLTEAGRDARSESGAAAMVLLAWVADAVRASWGSWLRPTRSRRRRRRSGRSRRPHCAPRCTPDAEGFTLYSLYPESYLEAATAASLQAGPERPAAAVAAGFGA